MKNNEIRKEYKFIINKNNSEKLFNLMGKKLEKIYQPRVVKSLYMDTQKFKLFNESQDEDIDKFTIRYRTYSNSSSVYLEVKKNLQKGKYKEKFDTDFNNLNQINYLIFNKLFTVPTLFVSYSREYYKFNNARITLDTRIEYSNTLNRSLSTKSYCADISILEIKLLNEKDLDIESIFFDNPQAFSKYRFGISKIYNIE